MKIAILTYTHWRDMHRAITWHCNIPKTYTATNGVQIDFDKIWVIESKDKKIEELKNEEFLTPLTKNFVDEIIINNHPRGFSLNGVQCVVGMISVFKEVFKKGYDAIIKLDADTILADWKFFAECFARGEQVIGSFRFPQEKHPNAFNGCCYSFAKSIEQAFNNDEAITNAVLRTNEIVPEDIFFHNLIENAFPFARRVNIDKSTVFMAVKPLASPLCPVLHFGYISNERAEKILREITIKRKEKQYDKSSLNFTPPFSCDLANAIIDWQNNKIPERKIEQYPDRYDEQGNQIENKQLPAGAILAGYDKQNKPVWQVPKAGQQINIPAGLKPLPQ